VKKVGLGVVGAGGIGRAYADLLAKSDTALAVAFADMRLEMAHVLATPLECLAVPDLEALLEVPGIEAVVVCTPPSTHDELVARALDAGHAVLCEKPLAVNGRRSAALAERVARAGLPMTVATKFRFCSDVVEAGRLMAAGALGTVRLLENAFTSRVDMSSRWNSDPTQSGGGVVIDNGVHSVDLVRFLLGPVTAVLATEAARPAGWLVEDTARLQLRTAAGIDAHVELSWSIDKSLPDFLRVYGTDGELRVGWRESAWRVYGGEWQVFGPGYGKHEAMGGALDRFCRAVRGEDHLDPTAADAAAAVHVIDAAYESLRRGSWVEVGETAG
jgi:predicted dehydrogenase